MANKQSNSAEVKQKKILESIAKAARESGLHSLKRRYREKRIGKPTRTTFTLQENSIEALNELDKMFGFTPREVFSEAAGIENLEGLPTFQNLDEGKRTQEKVKKSYSIDDYALNRFKKIAKENNISRDYCIELFIDLVHETLSKVREEDIELIRGNKEMIDEAFKIIAPVEIAKRFGDEHFLTVITDSIYCDLEKASNIMRVFIETGIWEEIS